LLANLGSYILEINLKNNYNFLFTIVTILIINNFLFCKFVSKLVTMVINNFWSLKLVVNDLFSCSSDRLDFIKI